MSNSNQPALLVTGASGQLGRLVLEELLTSFNYKGPIIALSRDPSKLAAFEARGVTLRKGSFDDSVDTLAEPFAGAERVLLVSTDALDRPGHRLEQHRRAIDAAVAAGVKHVVYTSLAKTEPGTPVSIAPDHWGTEQALAKSPLAFTILRNNLYADLLLQSLNQAYAHGGTWAAAAGDQGANYVTRADCARAAAAALIRGGSERSTLEIGGPAAVTHAEIAKIASELTGKPLSYAPVSAGDLAKALGGAGLPSFVVDLLVTFDEAIAKGILAVDSPALRNLIGREPESVRAFLTANKSSIAPAG